MPDNQNNLLQRGLETIREPLESFIKAQTTTSWFLFLATIIALWWANSDYADYYQHLTHTPVGIIIGEHAIQGSLKHFVNDGLMVLFFFLLGLEMKREVLAGNLAQPENRRMLVLCAIGGMAMPAVIYSLFNHSLDSSVGWGIPMATDSAFALGILALVRKHIPNSLLAFLVGLAIVDDVGAILVIAIFYAKSISIFHLGIAFGLIALLMLGNYAGIRRPIFYVVVGIATWSMMLKSGVHATFAGVAIALTIPANPKVESLKLIKKTSRILGKIKEKAPSVDVLANRRDHNSVLYMRDIAQNASTPLRRWEDAFELPVNLVILPLFVFSNAGIPFDLTTVFESIHSATGLGIILGLVIGKLLGISGMCWIALKLRVGLLPVGVTLQHIVGLSLIAGIGFTMSTFIATLGFSSQPEQLQIAKSSILIASLIAAIVGLAYLRITASVQKMENLPSEPTA